MGDKLIAEQFEISRRLGQQLAKPYRETDEIPGLGSPDSTPYAEYPNDLEDRVLVLHQRLSGGAVAIAHVLRVSDGLSIANNRVYVIPQEDERVSENSTKQGRRRPWVHFEGEYTAGTIHMDRYRNDRGQWYLVVEDDASQCVFDMIETDSSSAERCVNLLETVYEGYKTPVPILEVITDRGSEFTNPCQDNRLYHDYNYEHYINKIDLKYMLFTVERPQSNGKIERFFQAYEKHRQRFGTLEEFLTFYIEEQPHMSLDWDNLKTPADVFDRLVPSPMKNYRDLFTTVVIVHG